jgi:F0F1-type ATP synthase assembly protein I
MIFTGITYFLYNIRWESYIVTGQMKLALYFLKGAILGVVGGIVFDDGAKIYHWLTLVFVIFIAFIVNHYILVKEAKEVRL